MKRTFPIISLLALVWLTACSTLERDANRQIGSISVQTDAAISAFNDYTRSGKGTIRQHEEFKELSFQYQSALRFTIAAINAHLVNPKASEPTKALAILAASSEKLTAFVYSLTQTPP